MTKYITITTENKYVYRIPADVVAHNRAEYYRDDPDSSFDEEYKYTMENDNELLDWFGGNMNWSQVSGIAELVSKPEQDTPVIGQDETDVINE